MVPATSSVHIAQSVGASVVAAASTVTAAASEVPGPSHTHEDIMEAMMRSYEEEMKHPISGLLFGNLMTGMLIQVHCVTLFICFWFLLIIIINVLADAKVEGAHRTSVVDNGSSSGVQSTDYGLHCGHALGDVPRCALHHHHHIVTHFSHNITSHQDVNQYYNFILCVRQVLFCIC